MVNLVFQINTIVPMVYLQAFQGRRMDYERRSSPWNAESATDFTMVAAVQVLFLVGVHLAGNSMWTNSDVRYRIYVPLHMMISLLGPETAISETVLV